LKVRRRNVACTEKVVGMKNISDAFHRSHGEEVFGSATGRTNVKVEDYGSYDSWSGKNGWKDWFSNCSKFSSSGQTLVSESASFETT